MRLIFLGAPGSGKGTQADIMKEKHGFITLSTGDLLRGEIEKKTELGEKAQTYMNEGKLVPDDIMIGILENKIAEFESAGKSYILDGFPRTLPQAKALDAMLDGKNVPLDAVILIDVPEDELLRFAHQADIDPQNVKVISEPLGINLFLRVKKPG